VWAGFHVDFLRASFQRCVGRSVVVGVGAFFREGGGGGGGGDCEEGEGQEEEEGEEASPHDDDDAGREWEAKGWGGACGGLWNWWRGRDWRLSERMGCSAVLCCVCVVALRGVHSEKETQHGGACLG